ncbi:MGMT family protein [Solicola sp. PLA-1-18]|uniref:MGMT family protein n=1 Tax=Solicola sp. PLA-1-18 TaxID=3380532 RepID=UPI003B76796A
MSDDEPGPGGSGLVGFSDDVLDLAESVPPGHVVTYGGIAAILGRGGARHVGRVMALEGAAVCWWRVVRADGTLPPHLASRAREHYLAEGTPLRGRLDGPLRVDVAAARWAP